MRKEIDEKIKGSKKTLAVTLESIDSKINWSVDKETITEEEVDVLVGLFCAGHKYFHEFGYFEKIKRYILKELPHPIDGIYIGEQHLSHKSRHVTSKAVKVINGVALCLAIKYREKIPMSLLVKPLYSLYHHSIHDEALFFNSASLKEHVIGMIQSQHRILKEKKKRKLLFLVQMLLLVSGKSMISELTMSDVRIKDILYLKEKGFIGCMDGQILNVLYENLFDISPFNVKQDVFIRQLSQYEEDEIAYLYALYEIYLSVNKRGKSQFNTASAMLAHKPNDLKLVSSLTKDNLMRWIDNYFIYAETNQLQRMSCQVLLSSFLKIIIDMKRIFEQKNIFNEELIIPCSTNELIPKIRAFDIEFEYEWDGPNIEEDLHFSSLEHYVFSRLKSINSHNEKGTLKMDLLEADKIVRAIYNYKVEGDESSSQYFNELQLTTMLRIIADSGVRSIEVINMINGSLSYLKEEDVYICILGWSKLFERFGVVPISNETAAYLKKCEKLRENYPQAKIPLKMKDYTESKTGEIIYEMQFVNIHTKNGKSSLIHYNSLKNHLHKICKQDNIQIEKGKGFHGLRHRAAEYFFFCMSYYNFDKKNDHEYKEMVVQRLLRHKDVNMTREYYWGELQDLVSKHGLVFLKSLPDVARYDNTDAQHHKETLIKRINQDLEGVVSAGGIDKISKLLTAPHGLISEETLQVISREKNFNSIMKFLTPVNGNKGAVPIGAAAFGKCTNLTCPKLREKITCINCENHILTEQDIPVAIRELIECSRTIQEIYKYSYNDTFSRDHLKSLRSRVSSLVERLDTELNMPTSDLIDYMQKQMEELIYGITTCQ